MKGALVAAAGAVVLAAAVTVLLRAVGTPRRVTLLLRAFLVSLPVVAAAYAATPDDLWVLPAAAVDARPVIGLAFGLFVYAALFFGGLLQLYNLADRGFSLRVVIDVAEGLGTHAALLRGYGGGRGLDGMLDKRVDGILEEGFARVENGRLVVTARGRRTARVVASLRDFLRLDGR